MAKSFQQITFEFLSQEEEQKASQPAPQQPAEEPPRRGRRKLKDAPPPAVTDIPEDEILFQKQYYSIGEVARMFNVNNSLLRYWEKEFDILKLRKNKKGDRFFRPTDIKNLQLIYDLLRRRKYTIEGARAYLKKAALVNEKHQLIVSLQKLRSFLLEIKANL